MNIRTKYGCPPQHVAGYKGHQECTAGVALLLMLRAKIDSLDVYSETPLHRASRGGETDTVKMLMDCGADTEMRNSDGKTSCDIARKEEIKSLFEEFIQKDGLENKSQLMKNAIDAEKWDVATILALKGASEDTEIFKDLLTSATNSENINVDCILALLAKIEGGLSSIDNKIKRKLLSSAVQSKNSVAVKTLSAANVDENSNFQ